MKDSQVFTEERIRSAVKVDGDALERVEAAFAALSRGEIVMPPIQRMDIRDSNGEIDVKSAYIPGFRCFAVKMSTGFFDNPRRGLPSGSGLMVLFSAETGMLEAVLLDHGYLTDLRTGLAGAVAARALAPEPVTRLGILGAGKQAWFQLLALRLVRQLPRVAVWSPGGGSAERFAAEARAELGLDVVAEPDAGRVIQESNLVVSCTPARSPVIPAESLHPGLHITCMGSDAEDKNELDPRGFQHIDRVVCDQRAQCFRLGELHHGAEAGVIQPDQVLELGEVLSSPDLGRQGDEEITFCDLTGTGAQDTAIANFALERLRWDPHA